MFRGAKPQGAIDSDPGGRRYRTHGNGLSCHHNGIGESQKPKIRILVATPPFVNSWNARRAFNRAVALSGPATRGDEQRPSIRFAARRPDRRGPAMADQATPAACRTPNDQSNPGLWIIRETRCPGFPFLELTVGGHAMHAVDEQEIFLGLDHQSGTGSYRTRRAARTRVHDLAQECFSFDTMLDPPGDGRSSAADRDDQVRPRRDEISAASSSPVNRVLERRWANPPPPYNRALIL